MFKVTPLRETPTHWLTILPDDMLIFVTLDSAGLLPRLLKKEDDELNTTYEGLRFHLHVFNLKFMFLILSVA